MSLEIAENSTSDRLVPIFYYRLGLLRRLGWLVQKFPITLKKLSGAENLVEVIIRNTSNQKAASANSSRVIETIGTPTRTASAKVP